LARADEIKQQKRRENIIANAELARLSRQLVELRKDVPLEVSLEDFQLDEQDGPKLIAFLKAMEFTTLTRRVAEATGADASTIDAANVPVEWGDEARGPDLDAKGDDKASEEALGELADGADLTSGNVSGSQPSQLAASRAALFADTKIDHKSYQTVR